MEVYTVQGNGVGERKVFNSPESFGVMEALGKKFHRKFRVQSLIKRELLAEFAGTCFLVTIGTGSVAQWLISKQERNAWIGINLCWGFGVAFSAYVCGSVSGGHINPAISVMQWVLGNMSFGKMLLYSVAQTAGAFFASVITFITYYDAINSYDGGVRSVHGDTGTAGIFASYPAPYISVVGGVIDQIVGTAILGVCVAAIGDKRNKIPAHLHPLLGGLVVAMIGMCFGMNCGYPINPGRDLGPRIFTLIAGWGWEVFSYKNYTWFWVPIVGPTLGAVFGAWAYKIFIGIHWPDESDGIIPYDNGKAEESELIAATKT